ncbi:hypothetical protein RyT2_11180 [Pseudolactococcus yaeyamensis]
MISDYEKKKQEIELFCLYLQQNDMPENYILENKDNNSKLLRILKSNALIMFYNLIESTVRSCIMEYYDTHNVYIKSYSEASDEIKKIWLKYSSYTIKEQSINQDLFSIIQQTFLDTGFSLDIKQFHLSGNVDVAKIKYVFEKHGIQYDGQQLKDNGGTILSIKNQRNALAHGNISFTKATENLTTEEVVGKYKQHVFECLDYVVEVIETEIEKLNGNLSEYDNPKWRKINEF